MNKEIIVLSWSSLLSALSPLPPTGKGKLVAVSLELNKASVVDCIRTIEQQTDYTFIFDDSVVATGTVTFSCSNMPLEDVLRRIFTPRGVGFELTGKQILLKKPERKTAQVTFKTISGIIKDESDNLCLESPSWIHVQRTECLPIWTGSTASRFLTERRN